MNRTIALTLAAVVAATVVPARPAEGGEAKGKTIYRGTYGSRVRTLDPAACEDTTSAAIQAHVFEGLYGYHYLKRPVEVVPVLAAGLPTVSADGLTVMIRLKPAVRYARNACFGRDAAGGLKTRAATAADVVLAIKRIADRHVRGSLAGAMIAGRIVGLDAYRRKTGDYPAGDFGRYGLKVEGLSATDDRTVRIKLVRPWPQLVHVLAMHCFAPIPREAVDRWLTTTGRGEAMKTIPVAQRRADFTRPEQMVGTGPYVMTGYQPGGRIVFVRNPDFRDDRYPAEGAAGEGARRSA